MPFLGVCSECGEHGLVVDIDWDYLDEPILFRCADDCDEEEEL